MANQEKKIKKPIGVRILRILLKTVLILLLFFVALVLLIQTAPVQNFIRGKAVAWLEKKLNTRIAVEKIYIGFPKDVVIEGIYIEDREKDTLLSAGKIKADISLLKLLRSEIEINDLFFDNITAKVKRQLPDTAFNFQFIIDAFGSTDKKEVKPAKKDTANNLTFKNINLNKIRLVYKDTITGSDMEAMIGTMETRISTFDLAHMKFDVPRFKLDGFTAKVYQSKPLVKPEPESKDIAEAKEPVKFDLTTKEISLQKINIDYRNNVSSVYTYLDLQNLLIHPDKIDLSNRTIDLDDFTLQGTTAAIRLGKTKQAKIVEKETKQEVKSQAEAGWKITAASVKLDSNNLKFDNDNNAPVKKGIDYGHLDAREVTIHADKFYFDADSISGNLNDASLTEKSGLQLQKLNADFAYGKKGAFLKDFYLKTPGTELRNEASIRYVSLESLKNNSGKAEVNVVLQKSRVSVKDVLLFVPSLHTQPAFADGNSVLYIDSKIHGTIADLKIDKLQLKGLSNTNVDISGTINGLPQADALNANLSIRSLQTSKKDVLLFVPDSAFPQNLTIPDEMNVTGNIKGNKESFSTALQVQTNLGAATINADVKNLSDSINANYTADIETDQLDLGTLLQKKDMLGPVSASFTIKGSGLGKTTADATIDGLIKSAVIKQYIYHDLKLNGSIARQQAKVNAALKDPNISFSLDASANLAANSPSVKLVTTIDSIKTLPLHFTTDSIVYRGKIDADFPVLNPDSLQGRLYVTNSLLVNNEQRIKMDTILIDAGHNDSGQYVHLESDVANAAIEGRYKLTQLGSIFQQAIEPYFSVDKSDSAKQTTPYDFKVTAKVLNKPAVKTFIPVLRRMDSVTLSAHFSDDNGWNAQINAPLFETETMKIHGLVATANAENSLRVNANVKLLSSGQNIILYNTTLKTLIKDNKIDFAVNIRDKADKNKYNLSGLFEQPEKGAYRFSIKPDSLLLNYDEWTIAKDNKIELSKETVLADNFNLSKNNQKFSLNSQKQSAGSPLEVSFTDFKLETLTAFVQPDSTLIGGTLNGKAIVSDLPKQPVFTGDLSIADLNIKHDTAGNVKLLVNNKTANTYSADITLTGRGNDVKISGSYYAKQADNNLDMILDLKQLPLTTAEAFSDGAITKSSGSVNGRFTVKGKLDQPKINGDLNFVQAAFNPTKLGTRFAIDNEKLQVNEQGILFDKFTIKDSSGNEMTLNGTAATKNFINYNFDFTVRANDFQASSSTKRNNKLFYGRLFFNTNLRVKGTELAPVVDGRLTVNDKTKFTVVLPQPDPGVENREGVVAFVDKDAPQNDSVVMKDNFDTLNTLPFKGADISVNIEIKKEAELTLIVDEGSGDFLNVHGEALLTTTVDPSGKIILAGSYELQEGTYQLTLNILRRRFNIQKGSKIVWAGEPTQADVNIIAAYEVSTAPLDLVKNQLGNVTTAERNTYLQKLPFQVFLKMTGKLLQPKISFDVVLPENKDYNAEPNTVAAVRSQLEMLRMDEGELNKQVFALLLLNRFVAENPFNSSTSTTTGTLVRQSASKLITEQLNRLAESLVKGVDLNFDVQSSDDYTTGERQDRTDLNVGVSKRLLNDRLTVTVGSNFELEGPQNSNQNSSNIAGNVALNYRLSKDGRYMLRAYRKNEYQGVIDGYIIETGLGFIITLDYNKFWEILHPRKTERRRREARRKALLTNEPGQTQNAPADKTKP